MAGGRTRPAMDRRTFLARTGGLAAGSLLAGGCSRLNPQADGGGDKTLRLMELYTVQSGPAAAGNQEWLRRIVQQFQEENAGWKVRLEGFQWDQIDQRAILDLRAGVAHDVVFSSPQLMAKHAAAGTFADLTPFLDRWDDKEMADFTWSPVWKSASFGGQQLGVPVGVHTRGVAFRRDMFERAGLDPDAQFTSPDELVDAAAELTEGDVWGLGVYLGPERATIELAYAPLVWHFGGDFYDPKAKKAVLVGDASLRAVGWLSDLVHKHKVAAPFSYAPQVTYDDLGLNNFLNGKAAQSFGFGSYWIEPLEDKGMISRCFPPAAGCEPGDAGMMVVPTRPKAQFTNAWLLSIHRLSKKREMAWKLIQLCLRPENLLDFPDAGLPARLSAWESADFGSDFYRTWFEAARSGRPMPPTPYYPELADTVAAALQEVLNKGADAEQTMARFEREWNDKYGGR
ncbi:MAG: extracellular solute-binding protein [Streptosporangiales bacterium]|nr:extracellular solute-binding protein [Streptosporangiales bacterium]